MQKNKIDIVKIILYVLGTLTALSSIFMYINSEIENYSKWWALFPLILGITIILVNKFVKVN